MLYEFCRMLGVLILLYHRIQGGDFSMPYILFMLRNCLLTSNIL